MPPLQTSPVGGRRSWFAVRPGGYVTSGGLPPWLAARTLDLYAWISAAIAVLNLGYLLVIAEPGLTSSLIFRVFAAGVFVQVLTAVLRGAPPALRFGLLGVCLAMQCVIIAVSLGVTPNWVLSGTLLVSAVQLFFGWRRALVAAVAFFGAHVFIAWLWAQGVLPVPETRFISRHLVMGFNSGLVWTRILIGSGLGLTAILVLIRYVLGSLEKSFAESQATLGILAQEQEQRARAVMALRLSEEKFAKAFHLSPNTLVISTVAEGRIIEANETFCRRYGLSLQDVKGRLIAETGAWPSPAHRQKLLAELAAHGRVRNFLKESHDNAGNSLTTLISAELITIGEQRCLLSVGQDLTELIASDRARAQSANELRLIFDNTVVGIALVAADGKPLRCNRALESFLGYSEGELTGMSFAEFTHPDDSRADVDLYLRLVAREIESYQMEKRYVRKDGVVVWGFLTVSAVRKDDGHLDYCIGIVRDISAEKAASEALRRTEAEKKQLQAQLVVIQKLEAVGQLAGGVAHDFNNILSAIMLHLDLLRLDAGTSPSMRGNLDELMRSARRAASLTRQLLMFSRREPAKRELFDVNALIGSLLKMLRRLIRENITVVQQTPAGPLWLHADSGMIEQIIMNLAVNARDAMPQGGTLTIATETVQLDESHPARHPSAHPGSFVRLIVADTGTGMTSEVQARIFEPFFTTKEVGQGTGLGLATVHGIVQQHEGWVEVESAPDEGSRFTVYLPAPPASQVAAPHAAPPPALGPGGETILVVEDDDTVRAITVAVLKAGGYQVFAAETAVAAVRLLPGLPAKVDLLLTDVVLPGGMSGPELAADLRARGQAPRILFVSGYTAEINRAAMDCGAFLQKPFDRGQLLRTVRDCLDGRLQPGST